MKTHVVTRSCVVCRKRAERAELVRFILSSDGTRLELDKGVRRKRSRGAYVHDKAACLRRATEIKIWKRALRVTGSVCCDAVAERASTVVDGTQEQVMTGHVSSPRGKFLQIARTNAERG